MRLLDTYATNTGSKIDKPFIYTKYFPLPPQTYITIQGQTPYDSRNYSIFIRLTNGLEIKDSTFSRVNSVMSESWVNEFIELQNSRNVNITNNTFNNNKIGIFISRLNKTI
jgi:parallel beta-helix repeat protein